MRIRIRVRGAVQGVGFRPFVHRVAHRLGLAGFVLNDADGVLVEAEGERLDELIRALRAEAPPRARVDEVVVTPLGSAGDAGFEIRPSIPGAARTGLVADAATCEECLRDMRDPDSRFFEYPFVTCTNCGPRFSITKRLPFDRANTSMAKFAMCAACDSDYHDPNNRRFHAETLSCAACGPRLGHSVAQIAAAITDGKIVAVKSIGGFHLMCDAANSAAVAELRRRKHRPAKPFAIMQAGQGDRIMLREPPAGISPLVAPGLDHVGVMHPYTPLHHLLFDGLPANVALVATSANRAGEPLMINNDDNLSELADLVVTHDREILLRADDSVMNVIDGAPAYIRRSRGAVPEPIDLGSDGPCVLAVGARQKSSITITRGREAFVSQHIGDLDNAATIRFHRDTIKSFCDLLAVRPEAVACDLHPDFASTHYAEASGFQVFPVQHHAAHLGSVLAEYQINTPCLGLALDGFGLGDDGGAWGGELMRVAPSGYTRLGHLLPLPMPGADRAAREPWRMGVGALQSLGRNTEAARWFPEFPAAALAEVSAPGTSSLGRLFDAAAALLGVCELQNYEGQAAMELEALVTTPCILADGYTLDRGVLDFRPLLAMLLGKRGDPVAGAELFHGTVAAGLAALAATSPIRQIALSGGCMVNRVLAESLANALRARGFVVYLPRLLPANDGGLSLGQAWFARNRLMEVR